MRSKVRGQYRWKTKTCVICHKSFQPNGPHQTYCSMQCRFEDAPIKKDSVFGCWIWIGSKSPKGYGQLRFLGRFWQAHTFSWECHYGTRPSGLCVCHSCHNPSCVNPHHLYLATSRKNTYDSQIISRLAKKLTPDDVVVIKKLFTSNLSNRKIAKIYEVSPETINRIKNGVAWVHI